MNIWIILTFGAAIFLGWSMGPLIELLGKKVAESESAKRSEAHEQIMYNTKVAGVNYEKGTTNPYYNPEAAHGNMIYREYAFTAAFFGSTLIYFLTQNSLFIKVALVCLLLVIWKHLIVYIWELVTGLFS